MDRVRGAGRPISLPVNAAASAALVTTSIRLVGWAAVETAGTATRIELYDHASAASGQLLAVFACPASGEAHPLWLGGDEDGDGVRALNGIFVNVVGAGTIKGVFYVAD